MARTILTRSQTSELDKLEDFASFYWADFYRLLRNTDTLTLRREDWQVPATVGFGEHRLVPLCAGKTMKWKLAD